MENNDDQLENEENRTEYEKEESEDEESEKDDDDEDYTDEHEDNSEVNKALEDAIQNALRDADALETESIKSDVSDDTMLKLDEKLADVFKLHAKSGKVKNRIEQTTLSFRMRCFEMLLIFVHSIDDTTVLMDIVLPLLEIIQQASKFGHQHSSIVRRANFVMNAVCIKKLNLDKKCGRTGDELCSIIDGIFKLSNCTADICVQSTCFEALKFVLRIGAKLYEHDQAYFDALKKIVDEKLELFIIEKTCLTSANHFNYIFEKYPDTFLSNVINLVEKLSDNNLRIFRSTELSTFCQLILSKVNLSSIKEDKLKLKTVKKFMKIFIPFLFEILDKLHQILSDKPKSHLKSTFLLAILNVAKCLQRFYDAQIMKFDCESDNHQSIDFKFDKQQIDHYRDVIQNLAHYKMFRTKGRSTQNHSVLCTLLKKNLVLKPQRFFADLGKLFFTNLKTGDQEESDNDDQKKPMKKKKLES
uniref:Uncharacterized protein n=1 Tax=Romanomermis culicivorax TaxID=13658 RepID=A0A915K2N0_ROMCU